MKTEYLSKDQDWQAGTTTYWFRLTGADYGTSLEFDGDTFGIVEGEAGATFAVDADGAPITPGDGSGIAARRHCVVTEAMRED